MGTTVAVKSAEKETKSYYADPAFESKLAAIPKCFVERRSHPRFPFTAAVTAVKMSSGARIDARTVHLGAEGCYVDAMNTFPVGTAMQLRLTKDGESFRADAKVAYCQVGVGMGLLFSTTSPEQLSTLKIKIDNVPPGTYTLAAWHELYGAKEQTITISAREEKTATITFNDRNHRLDSIPTSSLVLGVAAPTRLTATFLALLGGLTRRARAAREFKQIRIP